MVHMVVPDSLCNDGAGYLSYPASIGSCGIWAKHLSDQVSPKTNMESHEALTQTIILIGPFGEFVVGVAYTADRLA